MENLTRKTLNSVREDDAYLSKKLYQGILKATHSQANPEIKEFEFNNLKFEDDITKIIDNLVNIYESKLNDLFILNNNILENKIGTEDIRLLKNIVIYNSIIISWNYISKQLIIPTIPKNTLDKINDKLQNNLLRYINSTLENLIELGNNISKLIESRYEDTLVNLMKLISITQFIQDNIITNNYKQMKPNDLVVLYNTNKDKDIFEPEFIQRINNAEGGSTKTKGIILRNVKNYENEIKRIIKEIERVNLNILQNEDEDELEDLEDESQELRLELEQAQRELAEFKQSYNLVLTEEDLLALE